jgi:hypothetical protein
MSITANGGTSALLGPPTLSFTGVAGDPALLQARSVDERVVDLYFSFAPLADRALDVTQYSISPPIQVVSVHAISPMVYRLTTSPQAIGQVYNITWPTH